MSFFNDHRVPEGETCLAAAEEEQVPGLMGEGQTEKVAGVAGKVTNLFAAGSKRRSCTTWARECKKQAGVENSKGGEQADEEA